MILVVDDDRSLRVSTVRLLAAHGYSALAAASADAALSKAKEVLPRVILMDLHMGGMGGIEATRRIKADPQLCDIPVIAISATPPLWEESRRMFATVLTKPAPSGLLIAAIEGLVREPPSNAPSQQ